MPSESRDDAAARPRHRWVVEVLLVVVVLHSIILTLWLAPTSPIRDAAGDGRLTTYVDPYFQQGTDTIGVGVQQVDESFRIRAFVVPDDFDASESDSGDTGDEKNDEKDERKKVEVKGKFTEWLDLTTLDNRANRRSLTPERVHLIARRLATNLNLAMFNLTPEQRKIVRTLKAEDVPSTVKLKLEQAGGGADAIRFFQAYDQMATQFASLYAESQWTDGRVVQVQFEVGRRTVPPYADRAKTSVRDLDFRTFSFGWRATFRGSTEARAIFDSYVKK